MTKRDGAPRHDTTRRVSRRTVLQGGLAPGAAGTAGLAGLSSSAGASIDRALERSPAEGRSHPVWRGGIR